MKILKPRMTREFVEVSQISHRTYGTAKNCQILILFKNDNNVFISEHIAFKVIKEKHR